MTLPIPRGPISPTLEPLEAHGWAARGLVGEARKDQGRPPAWKAQGEHHRGWVHQQAEVQELVLVIQVWWVGLPALFSVAWGWRWETCQGRDWSAGQVEEKR